jgi:hypothetical protein
MVAAPRPTGTTIGRPLGLIMGFIGGIAGFAILILLDERLVVRIFSTVKIVGSR